MSKLCWIVTALLTLIASQSARAAEPTDSELAAEFGARVRPFLKTYCEGCHGKEKRAAKLDLSAQTSVQTVRELHQTWEVLLERLEDDEMPPAAAQSQPTAAQRAAVVLWIRNFRAAEARRQAGDPGIVLARRLSTAEYDNTIRDLTGVDLRPTREFPVDPANEAGFDNSGESLTISPALLKKYLAAARGVADHLVVGPAGLAFAPHPVITETDRDKYCVRRIVDFYHQHNIDYADYFEAAWRFQHRLVLGQDGTTLDSLAAEHRLSAKYLLLVWELLTDKSESAGPLLALRESWHALPAPASKESLAPRAECERLRDTVLKFRQEITPKVERLKEPGISQGSQPLLLWRNRELAKRRLGIAGINREKLTHSDGPAERTLYEAALERYCRVFPDAFFITDRKPYFDEQGQLSGRLLTAGFHLMQGYFRDDMPLYELVLTDDERRELDRLWLDLNFITRAPPRQYKDFIFFERAEPPRTMHEARFDFARAEDKDSVTAPKMTRLREEYLAKARELKVSETGIEAIEVYFDGMSALIRDLETRRLASEPVHLDALVKLAERAYRQPLSPDDQRDLRGFYRLLREQDGLSHEEALRDLLASVLVSPHFSYRFDLAGQSTGVRPLTDYELASRLSYFLWSSMPDAALLERARAGDLHEPTVLKAEVARMLRDQKVRGLAVEFGANWLDFRRFEEHNSVDRERFPAFDNELRLAMFEEPVRFLMDAIQVNQPVTSLLDAKHTFVNPSLAKFYGLNIPATQQNEWVRIDDARDVGRGGLLTMSVFLTKNSPGLRTSPVKRGYWVVKRLLGERIPAPPPNVPELPADEAAGTLSLPQMLARHRNNAACSGCHDRFDSIGLAFEAYGPVGERRTLDLGGRPVENRANFPGGADGEGIDGLREYLLSRRREEFVDNLSRKLLSYAFSRSLIPADDLLLNEIEQRLSQNDYRFQTLIETIVTSRQFLNCRGEQPDSATEN